VAFSHLSDLAEAGLPMNSQLEHGFANLGDVTIHYPPVVLIHGWPQTWYMWRDIMPGLAHRYRVIAPDLRGLGESSRPLAGYDKKTMSDDIWRPGSPCPRRETTFRGRARPGRTDGIRAGSPAS
jgi:pimeloyl-ACP methyl ester carboxylesterase